MWTLHFSDDSNPDVLDTLTTIHKSLHSTVSANISTAQEHQKRAFDRRHNSHKYITAGLTVYIKNQRRIHRMGSKMEPRWVGPYTLVESLTKGRVKLKNSKTGKLLSNTYHASNLKIYQHAEASPSPHHPHDCPSGPDSECPKQKTLKRPHEEPDNDNISPKHKQSKTFNPLPSSRRKYLSTTLGLTFDKVVYNGRTRDLGQPRRIHKTKGDGNCYFRAISYILTGSEHGHSLLREKVIHHMNTNLTRELHDYLDQHVNDYVNTSGISRDGVWATDAEIMATANLLSCDIIIHTELGDSMDWLTYPASFSMQSTTEHALYLENKHDHFDVVISV